MTELPNNSDFLKQTSDISKALNKVKEINKTKDEIIIPDEDVYKRPLTEEEKYPEYYALCENSRRCLVATNYFNVLYGNNIIEVPISDEHYHKYFDKRCYDRAESYQKEKKLESEYNEMIYKYRKQTEKNNKLEVEEILVVENIVKPEENEKSNRVTVVEDKVIEIKVDVVAKKEEMPIEENKNFLEEKREHPVYPKREKIEYKKEPEPELKKEVKKEKVIPKKSNNDNAEQISLF